VSVNGTLVEDKMRRFKGECALFSFNKCPIYAHDGASAKFSTNSHETDNSAMPSFSSFLFFFFFSLPLCLPSQYCIFCIHHILCLTFCPALPSRKLHNLILQKRNHYLSPFTPNKEFPVCHCSPLPLFPSSCKCPSSPLHPAFPPLLFLFHLLYLCPFSSIFTSVPLPLVSPLSFFPHLPL
jgi:hypothetical protein